jgi:hypothetical protein
MLAQLFKLNQRTRSLEPVRFRPNLMEVSVSTHISNAPRTPWQWGNHVAIDHGPYRLRLNRNAARFLYHQLQDALNRNPEIE